MMVNDGNPVPFVQPSRVGLVAVRKHPGVETPGYCRVVPLGRQVADDEAASGFPERFAFRQVQTARRRLAMTHRHGRNINANHICPKI